MINTTTAELADRLATYAAELRQAGAIRTDTVERAFAAVPRHRCLQRFRYRADEHILDPDTTPAADVLGLIYANNSLITHTGRDGDPPSSSSAPDVNPVDEHDPSLRIPTPAAADIQTDTGRNDPTIRKAHMSTAAELDAEHRAWLRTQLEHAAGKLGVTIAGEPVYGWRDRTIGARVTSGDGDRWLRMTSELSWWARGEFWTGNRDAQAIPQVPKPHLLARHDWADGQRELYAELMTLVPSPPIAEDMVLRHPVDLDRQWWTGLYSALDALSGHPTERVSVDTHDLRVRLLAAFGVDIDAEHLELSTAHGDLHWNNVTAPTLTILDWEAWGTAPAGYDAAVLYCAGLLQPAVADQVHTHLADLLDTHTGRIAQLAAVAKLLRLVEDGEHLDLAVPLHGHARSVINNL